ncbi:rhomboid family intramembrane serine protease [Maricaulis sp.]|uniref:rhomboid family intramembrane serine protease n=1 Tax=Maricaulis sp. TaxID=1486257 RepID=UPI0025BA1C7B|nr:rhomboid family intramembrane serine protease [Maricaulis sp.]
MSVPQRDESEGPWNRPPPPRAPVFNTMPPAVLLLAFAIVGAALAGQVLPDFQGWLFNAAVFVSAERGASLPKQPLGPIAPLVLHVFIHFSLGHIAMNLAVLVAAGRAVGERLGHGWLGSVGFFFLFFACAVTGAAMETLFHQGPPVPMGGASTAVSGLIAGAGWVRGGWRGMAQLALPWIAINLLIGVAGDLMPISIGWLAHIGGTLGGMILTPLVIAVFAEDEA